MPVDDIDHTKLMSGSIWKLELETGVLLEEKKISRDKYLFLYNS